MLNGCVRASCTKVSLTTGATSPLQHLIWMFSCFISTPYHRQKLVRGTAQKQVTTFPRCPPGGLYNIRSLRRGICTELPHKVGESHRESPDYVGRTAQTLLRRWAKYYEHNTKICVFDITTEENTDFALDSYATIPTPQKNYTESERNIADVKRDYNGECRTLADFQLQRKADTHRHH